MRSFCASLLVAIFLTGCATTKVITFHAPERRETVRLKLDGQEKVQERVVFAWHEQDRKLASAKTYDAKGALRWTERYSYTDRGVLREIERRRPNGSLALRTRFQCDKSGRPIGTEVVDADGKTVPPSDWPKYQ